ncbi:MAG: hypothetical protein N3E41_08665 [Thermofilaceae archaeon]|nr:hypothetical protein [Thermofilaceae archaeon]
MAEAFRQHHYHRCLSILSQLLWKSVDVMEAARKYMTFNSFPVASKLETAGVPPAVSTTFNSFPVASHRSHLDLTYRDKLTLSILSQLHHKHLSPSLSL